MLRALVLCALAPLLVAGAVSATPSGGTPAVFGSVESSSQLVGAI